MFDKEIKMSFGEGLPWWQYFFCDGRIVVGVRDKGISQISYVGNQPVVCQDFFKGEEISFCQDGEKISYEKIDIFPFGFINNYEINGKNYSYWMAIEGSKIVSCFPELGKHKIEFVIPKKAIVRKVEDKRLLYEGLDYNKKENSLYFHTKDHLKVPDSDREATSSILREINVPKLPSLEIKGETFGAITSNINFKFKEDEEKYTLIFNENFSLAFLFSKSIEELKKVQEEYLKDPDGCFQKQVKRYSEKGKTLPEFHAAGSLNIGSYRNLSRFFRMQPLYIESMKIDRTGAFRACNSVYWSWGWDITLPCFGLLLSGDYDSVRNALLFLNKTAREDGSIAHAFTSDFRHYHTCSIGGPQNTSFLILVDRYFSLTNDTETLYKLSGQIEKIFTGISNLCDETGFYLTRGAGTDNPEEFGRTSYAYVSLEMGWWYEAVVNCEKMFLELNKYELYEKAKSLAKKMENNFLKLFYDKKIGYLYEAVHPENCPFGLSGEINDTPLITNIGCMLSSYGEYLIFQKEEEIANFCEKELLKEDGIHYKPIWEKRGYYGWKRIGENWFPRDDIYLARILRKAGKGKALERMMNLYEKTFAFYNFVFEGKTVSVKNPKPLICPGKWQAFASSAWYRSIIEGFAGIEIDEGGLTYIPADLNLNMELKNIRLGNTLWNVKIIGDGSYVQDFIVDGKEVLNTLKIPFSFYKKGKHFLEIRRKNIPPETPVLLEATGAKVKEVKLEVDKILIFCDRKGPMLLKFYSPDKISCVVNNINIHYLWNGERKIGLAIVR